MADSSLSSWNELEMTIKRTFHLQPRKLRENNNLKCLDLRPCVVTNGGTGVEGPAEDGIMGTAQVNSVIPCTRIRAWHAVLCTHRCASHADAR